MSCDSYNTIPTFKECAGKNCPNDATVKLKIKFIKKIGYFCESCTSELKTLDLTEQEEIDVDQRVGPSLNINMEDE
ncbi:MAG TPA: hypothetical protein VLA74_01060 [Nitrososphaeraceae archaeon]|nr:hypothetical protein [Nitrososphaeraceae archaeon]